MGNPDLCGWKFLLLINYFYRKIGRSQFLKETNELWNNLFI